MTQTFSQLRFPGRGVLRRARGPEARRWRWAWWLTPLFVFFFVGGLNYLLTKAVAALLALSIAFAAARRPDRALLTIFALIPFQTALLSYLFKIGVPGDIVRPLAAWKEALGIGILLNAIHAIVTGTDVIRRQNVVKRFRSALDRVDFLLLVYVGLVLFFALFPRLLSPDAPIGSGARSLAFRSTAGFVLLFFACRHAVFPPGFGARARKYILFSACAVAGIGIVEFIFSSWWNDFAINTLHILHYQVQVLGVTPRSFTNIRAYGFIGDEKVLRIGSVLFSPLVVGFYLLTAFGLAIGVLLRKGVRLASVVAATTIGFALIFTQTRAAMLGAVVIGLVAFKPMAGRPAGNRIRLALLLAAAVIVLIPAAVGTGAVDRATGAATGDDESTQDHIDGFWRGIEALQDAPLGHGLATSAGIGQRFGGSTSIVTENYYLQVGVETGLLGTVLFTGLVIAIARKLTAAADGEPPDSDGVLAGARGAFIGLAVGAILLHTFNDVAVAWTAWGAAGAMLGLAERARRPRPNYDGAEPAAMMWASSPAS